eukprot:COSAG04_NODE_427_length_14568_cov_27.728039_7_plen_144_part_01
MEVIDTHIHLTCRHTTPHLENTWLGPAFSQQGYYATKWDWGQDDLRAVMAASAPAFDVKSAVYIQCFNSPPLEEARWVLDLIGGDDAAVCGLVAEIPVPEGKAAVDGFLDALRDGSGALPAGLKGGRICGGGAAVAFGMSAPAP